RKLVGSNDAPAHVAPYAHLRSGCSESVCAAPAGGPSGTRGMMVMLRLRLARLRDLRVLALVSALGLAGAAVSAHADTPQAMIYACVNNSSGTIHVVEAAT